MPHIPFNVCQIWRQSKYALTLYGSILQVCKRSNFLKAYISEMGGVIYFRSGMSSLPVCQHLHRDLILFGLEIMEQRMHVRACIKLYFVLCVNILFYSINALQCQHWRSTTTYIVFCVGGSKRKVCCIDHKVVINCITVLFEPYSTWLGIYSTVMPLISSYSTAMQTN